MGRSGWPRARAWRRPKATNSREQIVSATGPRFETSTPSWTLHEVHEPQSPEPVMTTSHCVASSSTTVLGAGMAGPRLSRFRTARTP